MEIYIDKYILLEALQLTVNISPRTTTEPIINNIFIETVGEDAITIKATNHEISFSGEFEADIISPGKVCVSTIKLFNLVKELNGEKIQMTSTPQNWVFLSCKNSKIKLPGVDPGLFPAIEFKELDREFTISSEILKTAIDRTLFAIGENESRKNLTGLNLQTVSSDQIYWTGADSFRICQFITKLDQPINAEGNVIIPKKSLPEIKRIMELSEGDVSISFNDNIFQIIIEKVKFKTRLIESEYPNLDRLVNAPCTNSVNISKHELTKAVRILATITEGDHKSVMKISFLEGKIQLESQKLEFGEGNDEIFCDYDGKEMSIGLNIRYFLDALNAFENSDDTEISLNITNPEAPFIIQCEEWDNYKSVLMPVRIRW